MERITPFSHSCGGRRYPLGNLERIKVNTSRSQSPLWEREKNVTIILYYFKNSNIFRFTKSVCVNIKSCPVSGINSVLISGATFFKRLIALSAL